MIDLVQPYLIQLGSVVIAMAAIYLLGCGVLLFGQNRFIFFPSRTLTATPNDLNLPYEDIQIPVGSNPDQMAQIHGWWIPSSLGSNQPVLLHLHGNSSNISANLDHARQFYQMGLSVVLVDYRGYGQSTPQFPSEKAVYEDVEAVWNYLIDQRGIHPNQILVFGHSLGGAIAIELGMQHPDMAGLIVEGSFTSMRDMVDYRRKYRMFPINWLLQQRFNSIQKVEQLKMPVLFTHGTDDQVVPPSMSEVLYATATEPKQLLIVEQAAHNDVRQVGGVKYFKTLQQFVEKACSLQYQR